MRMRHIATIYYNAYVFVILCRKSVAVSGGASVLNI